MLWFNHWSVRNRLCLYFLLWGFSLTVHSRIVPLPESLKGWQEWVLYEHPEIHCPFLSVDQGQNKQPEPARQCLWASSLTLTATPEKLTFRQRVTLFRDTWVTLPGDNRFWPTNVRTETRSLPTRQHQDAPQVFLTSGNHLIEGEIPWRNIPKTLKIPPPAGLITLTVNDRPIARPDIDDRQQLWLGASKTDTKAAQTNSVSVKVFRHLKDSLPLELTTWLTLDVSGSERELLLGQVLPDNFAPLLLQSSLPARIEPDGQLRIQVKPGHWEVKIRGRHRGPLDELSYRALSPLWPAQEIWAFEAQPQLRLVQIGGADSVDPKQTGLPAEWQQLPAYLMTPDTHLKLIQQHRGDPLPAADKLELVQNIWLDFDGTGFTLLHNIRGGIEQSWRLNIQPDYTLGRVELNGSPELITRASDGNTGVEIRQSHIDMLAVSRHPRDSKLSASGWQTDFQRLQAQLHLPPGWSLFAATGVDKVDNSWVSRWNLWDIFLVLIIAAAIGRLCGYGAGVLALVTLAVIYQRPQAPLFIWLNLAAVLALMPLVSGRFRQWLSYYQGLSFLMLALLLIPFAVSQIRAAIYPQLEHPGRSMEQPDFATDLSAPTSAPPAAEMALDEYQAEARPAESEQVEPSHKSHRYASLAPKQQAQQPQYDPSRSVQTGPGIPQWRWNQVGLNWNGPVQAGETMRLTLVPPLLNRIGNLAAVALAIVLALRLMLRAAPGGMGASPGKWFGGRVHSPLPLLFTGICAAGLTLAPTQRAQADVVIDAALLKTLEQRLTAPPECLPDCASIESVRLAIENDRLQMLLVVNAQEGIAFPLPVQQRHWQPQSVTLNGSATALTYQRQQLLALVPTGRHRLLLAGALNGLDQLNLPLPLAAHNVSVHAPGWRVSGAQEGFSAHGLQISRDTHRDQDESSRLLPDPLPVFVTVERKIQLGLDWTLTTEVVRVTPQEGAFSLTLPLLPGESLTSENLNTDGREVKVEFAPQQQRLSWRSVLAKTDNLTLTAPERHQWVEIWTLESAPLWHTEADGIAPIKTAPGNLERVPQWRPWPGESITLTITRPEAVAGRYVSIDRVDLDYRLGQRSHSTQLRFTVRSSKGQHLPFRLPDKAQLKHFTVDGRPQPITSATGELKIPLRPATQEVVMHWQANEGIAARVTTPALRFPAETSNNRINMQLPADRWPLLVGGPSVGPAVLLWGWLAVIAIVAIGLGRSGQTPLKTRHWLLLGLGMSIANLLLPLIIVLWMFALAWRGRMRALPSQSTFQLLQLGLFGLSIAALLALLGTIPYSLLSSPDMHILGNGSSAYDLHWYQDRSDGTLPQAWVISLPMWSYRLVMLAWSLWLAFALLHWIRWGWEQVSRGGLWNMERIENGE